MSKDTFINMWTDGHTYIYPYMLMLKLRNIPLTSGEANVANRLQQTKTIVFMLQSGKLTAKVQSSFWINVSHTNGGLKPPHSEKKLLVYGL